MVRTNNILFSLYRFCRIPQEGRNLFYQPSQFFAKKHKGRAHILLRPAFLPRLFCCFCLPWGMRAASQRAVWPSHPLCIRQQKYFAASQEEKHGASFFSAGQTEGCAVIRSKSARTNRRDTNHMLSAAVKRAVLLISDASLHGKQKIPPKVSLH